MAGMDDNKEYDMESMVQNAGVFDEEEAATWMRMGAVMLSPRLMTMSCVDEWVLITPGESPFFPDEHDVLHMTGEELDGYVYESEHNAAYLQELSGRIVKAAQTIGATGARPLPDVGDDDDTLPVMRRGCVG